MMKTLLEHNTDLNLQNKDDDTSLIEAVKLKQEAIERMLLAYSADSNHQNKNCETSLIWAALMGMRQLRKMLLAYGADVNLQEENGNTALIWACYRLHLTVTAFPSCVQDDLTAFPQTCSMCSFHIHLADPAFAPLLLAIQLARFSHLEISSFFHITWCLWH